MNNNFFPLSRGGGGCKLCIPELQFKINFKHINFKRKTELKINYHERFREQSLHDENFLVLPSHRV